MNYLTRKFKKNHGDLDKLELIDILNNLNEEGEIDPMNHSPYVTLEEIPAKFKYDPNRLTVGEDALRPTAFFQSAIPGKVYGLWQQIKYHQKGLSVAHI